MKSVMTVFALPLLLMSVALADADRVWATKERAYSAFGEDRHRQFDFWIGEWDVNLRMIQDDLSFADTVRARASIYSILNGKAILEMWDSGPIKGYSLRHYDPQTDQWILWLNWPGNNRSNTSSLRGQFRHGRGEFRSQYVDAAGETITQRYVFADITPFSLRWDDLNSNDGGRTWRKNWRMEFSRTAKEPDWPLGSKYFPTYDTGARCDDPRFRPYELIAGHWHGKLNGRGASISAWHALDGCAVIAFLDIDGRPGKKRFMMLTFDTGNQQWETSYLDDDRDSDLLRLTSKASWAQTESGDHSLRWSVTGEDLEYSFSGIDGARESGRFRLQDH